LPDTSGCAYDDTRLKWSAPGGPEPGTRGPSAAPAAWSPALAAPSAAPAGCHSYAVQTPPPAQSPLERTARLLREQGQGCGSLGSPLYAALLGHAAADLLAGGPTADVLDGHLEDRGASALALRMLGGVHALVLSVQAPELAAYYPSAGGGADAGNGGTRAWAALRDTLAGHRDAVRGWLARPPQTNEVGRAAALIGGLRHIAAEAALPIRLVEIGASAGLNLRAGYFHVDGDAGRYGDPSSPVVLRGGWRGLAPPAADVAVIARTGGDVDPVDPATAKGRLTLTAYVWPDQADRLERLRSALGLAAQVPVDLRKEPASGTLARIGVADGSWTVLWHSVVRQYLDQQQRAALTERVSALGAVACGTARFAYLYLEPVRDSGFLVTLTTWPGGRERVLGRAAPHGVPVIWGTPAG
jgi:hypothetical protein